MRWSRLSNFQRDLLPKSFQFLVDTGHPLGD
jgi:hypothetical protein